jgi:hypothetical protein
MQNSTKTELVAVDMYMPKMLWSLYFMRSQGYDVEIVELYQDNKSTELLMKNRRFLSGKRTKHIKAKFFFIKDKIGSKEMRVVHQPSKEMRVDMLTKPLRGKEFKEMHAKLMNCAMNYEEKQQRKNEWAGASTSNNTKKEDSSWESDYEWAHPAAAGVCCGISH